MTERHLCHCYQRSFIYKILSQFFEISIFSQDIWGNVYCVPEMTKIFYFRSKTYRKKSETRFCRRNTTEDNNSKINVSPNIPCTFFLFKNRAFLQSFSPRNWLFWQVLRTPVFLNSNCLTFLYLLTYLFLC